jgi:hypothetical protein
MVTAVAAETVGVGEGVEAPLLETLSTLLRTSTAGIGIAIGLKLATAVVVGAADVGVCP